MKYTDLPSFWSQTIIAPWFPQSLTERSIELSKLHLLDVHLVGPIDVEDCIIEPIYTAQLLLNSGNQVRLLSLQDDAYDILEYLAYREIPVRMPILRVLGASNASRASRRMLDSLQLQSFQIPSSSLLEIRTQDCIEVIDQLSVDYLYNIQEVNAIFVSFNALLKLSKMVPNLNTIKIRIIFHIVT
ncbi:hypothetical protein M422DRAFT_254260 [Sphaerobolus stellatus SS14]|uniref:Uncharacterized protein n=1 Tax=Sphaerobolus stellatus (strain SS14) TaxID=990650 RepID=A0A0C9VV82_SPHS4|nr:hypothetical protein M422DRAFT_254260 [Sphaerobolus stellatus SS14]